MKQIKNWISNSIKDSQNIAKELSQKITSGDVVLMEGNLGAGKTFFVQQICNYWQVEEDVTSPTFTLIQNYTSKFQINHMDLYRIEDEKELDQLGWEDMVYSAGVTFIEWPQKVMPLLKNYWHLNIELKNEVRNIVLSKSE